MWRLAVTSVAVYMASIAENAMSDFAHAARPYFPAIAVVWCMMLRNPIVAMLAATGAGLVCDVQNATPLGLHVMPVVLLTWVARIWWTHSLTESVVLRWFWVAGVTTVLLLVVPLMDLVKNPSALDLTSMTSDGETLLMRVVATLLASTTLGASGWTLRRILFAGGNTSGSRLGNRWSMLTN